MKMSRLFGGESAMQERLVAAIHDKRTGRGISQDELDKMCGFGGYNVRAGYRSPTTEEFEANPRKMTSALFSAASFALDLNVDEVLQPLVAPEAMKEAMEQVVEQMRQEQAGVVASCGTAGTETVDCQVQAPVYAILKALYEMDEAATGC